MIVVVELVDSRDEVRCSRFLIDQSRLVLKDDQDRTVYVANVDRWLNFEVDYEDGEET